MSNTDQAPEPTMDEILASIRRIISDEPTDNQKDFSDDDSDSVAGDIARALSFDAGNEPSVSGMDEDILELTEVVSPRKAVSAHPAAAFAGHGHGMDNDFPLTSRSGTPARSDDRMFGNQPSQQLRDMDRLPFGASYGQDKSAEYQKAAEGFDRSVFGDPSIFSEEPPAGVDSQTDSGFDTDSFGGMENDLSAFEQQVNHENASSDFGSGQAHELEASLDWGSIGEGFSQDLRGHEENEPVENASDESNELAGIVESYSLPEESLGDDDNVTFGELSPEESLENALEQALEGLDPERGWDDPVSDDAVPEWDSQPEQASTGHEMHGDALENEEGIGENMDLSEASMEHEDKDELTEALAAVKQTVSQEVAAVAKSAVSRSSVEQPERQSADNSPVVSEVKPVQQTAPNYVSPLEESIKDMLKPMLKEWLDANMPRLLEGAMKEHAKLEQKK